MSDYIHDLDLDPEGREELALSLAEAYLGYADVAKEFPSQLWRASSQGLAAVYFSLVDPARGRTVFAEAAETYRGMGNRFWVTLAVCGQNIDEPVHWDAANDVAPDAGSAFSTLLATAWVTSASSRRDAGEKDVPRESPLLYSAIDRATHLGMIRVGRLGLPLQYYVLAAKESLEWSATESGVEALAALLSRAVEPIQGAKADRFHWQRLYSNVLPIEPEILATCLALVRRWERARPSDSLGDLGERLRISAIATVPLRLAVDMLHEQPGHERFRK
jgi:hypothetical protein